MKVQKESRWINKFLTFYWFHKIQVRGQIMFHESFDNTWIVFVTTSIDWFYFLMSWILFLPSNHWVKQSVLKASMYLKLTEHGPVILTVCDGAHWIAQGSHIKSVFFLDIVQKWAWTPICFGQLWGNFCIGWLSITKKFANNYLKITLKLPQIFWNMFESPPPSMSKKASN